MATPAPHPAAHTPRPADAAPVPYAKTPGEEPLPGYRLLGPLGRGGFGEVWKCEAPGGLHKAVKFVAPDPDLTDATGGHALRQEFDAFQHIKTIRHPFILQLERVELVAGELVMVMELADAQLQDRYDACTGRGLAGIPRDELLGYFADAAEALDVMGTKHGLQHLDIKPANLFLIGGHVKVGDYGLVARLEAGGPTGKPMVNRGLTPRYVAPEVLRGKVDPRSDQYSLALVYQELLTGSYPYHGKTAQQLMFQHVTAAPDLSGLPEIDRGPVARALSKTPTDRFPSCLAFVQALMTAGTARPGTETREVTDTALDFILRSRVDRSVAEFTLPPDGTATTPLAGNTGRAEATQRVPAPPAPQSVTWRSIPPLTVPGKSLPALTTPAQQRLVTPPPRASGPWAPPPARPPSESAIELTPAPAVVGVKLNPIYSVVPVTRLHGAFAEPYLHGADAFIEAVVAAAAGGTAPRAPGEVTLLPDGTWTCRFPSTLLPSVAPLKLTTLVEDGWCDEVTQPEPTRIVLRVRSAGGGGFWNKLSGSKAAGAEVTIRLPGGGRMIRSVGPAGGAARQSAFALAGGGAFPPNREVVGGAGEVEVAGYVYGSPDAAFARRAMDGIPGLIQEVRKLLQNVEDRRKAPRVPTTGAVVVYPITEDGMVQPAVTGVCRDVSAGGVCFVTQTPIQRRYMYVEFPEVGVNAGLAVLTRLVRANVVGYEQILAGRFRTDL